jgi:hypothetical protein
MKHRFVCQKHEDYGTNGWRLESQPGFDPLAGMAVAHDIIEHFPDGDESPADEFQALGASLLIRDGRFYRNYTPGINVASDFPEIIRHVIYEHMPLPEAPSTRPLTEGEEDIQEAMREGLKLMRSEFHDEDQQEAATELKKALGWLRTGYRRASKRFAGRLEEVRWCFQKIQAEADRLLEHANEGDILVIDVNLKAGRANCYIEEPSYEESYA